MKLSIFISGYRTDNWMNVCDTVPFATTLQDYEIVFVGPNEPSKELLSRGNVRFIKDKGCPSRCYQLGLLHSKGEYVVWAADDGIFSPTLSIDKAFESRPDHHKGIVTFKYLEGPFTTRSYNKKSNKAKARQRQQEEAFLKSDAYWHMYGHLMGGLKFVQGNYLLLMIGLMRRDYLMEIGGWDCEYEQPGIGCHDLAIRLQNDGAEIVLGEKMMDLDNSTSEHSPIEQAQSQHDLPLLQSMYNSPESENKTKIPFDNWKNCPDIWSRRFPNE